MRARALNYGTELFIVQWERGKGSSPGRVEGSSRAMLATARPCCMIIGITPLKSAFDDWFVGAGERG